MINYYYKDNQFTHYYSNILPLVKALIFVQFNPLWPTAPLIIGTVDFQSC